MVGIKEVAAKAGVSTATVSRVFNANANVGAITVAKIEAAAKVLGFRPNRLARALRQRKSDLIGLFLGNHTSPFATMLYSAIEDTLYREGFQAVSCCTRSQAEREQSCAEALIEMRVAGVIIQPSNSQAVTVANVRKLNKNGIHTVYIDRVPSRKTGSYVVCDNIAGGESILEHLVKLGHRHIGVVAKRNDLGTRKSLPGNLRIRGMRKVASRLPDLKLCFCEPTELQRFDLGYTVTTELLHKWPELTAITAVSDIAAVGAMHAAWDAGIKVPEELSIVGYDGIPLAGYLPTPLTTIVQPIEAMGKQAASYIVEKIRNPGKGLIKETLPVVLRESASSTKPRTKRRLSIASVSQEEKSK